MSGNDKQSTNGAQPSRFARRPKTRTAAKGLKDRSKNSYGEDLPRWRIKVYDTNVAPDDNSRSSLHVKPSLIMEVLEKQLQWVRDRNIELSIESGLFTSGELATTGPDTLNQILLCQLATMENGAPKYLEYNIASLLDALKAVGVIQFVDRPRTLNENRELWKDDKYYNIDQFAAGEYNGLTHPGSRVSVVAYFYSTRQSPRHNQDWLNHLGEWESHVCQHEIGHTFFERNSHPYDKDGHTGDNFFIDVMHPPNTAWHGDYIVEIQMTPEQVKDNGGWDQISKKFLALPNHSILSKYPGKDDITLRYKGYPGYSDEQKDIIAQKILDTWLYGLEHPDESQRAK